MIAPYVEKNKEVCQERERISLFVKGFTSKLCSFLLCSRPNQRRILGKLPPELRRRNFLSIGADRACGSAPKRARTRARNVHTFRPSFRFCAPPLLVGCSAGRVTNYKTCMLGCCCWGDLHTLPSTPQQPWKMGCLLLPHVVCVLTKEREREVGGGERRRVREVLSLSLSLSLDGWMEGGRMEGGREQLGRRVTTFCLGEQLPRHTHTPFGCCFVGTLGWKWKNLLA